MSNPQAFLNIGIQAARAAGDVIAQGYKRLDRIHVTTKAPNDFVSNIDKKAEYSIIETIQYHYPDHAFLGEETGEQGESDYCWIIDPLDGTTNFINGIPHFAVSIALRYKDKMEIGIVYDPIREELFTAIRGMGAQLNNHKIRVKQSTKLQHIITAFSNIHSIKPEAAIAKLEIIQAMLQHHTNIRFSGSAALDFAYVAAGRLDSYCAFRLKPWDIAAGAILILEAGGLVSDFSAEENYMKLGQVVAANSKISKELLKIIYPHREIFK